MLSVAFINYEQMGTLYKNRYFFSLINYSLTEWILYSLGDISIPKLHLLNLTILNNLFVPKATC